MQVWGAWKKDLLTVWPSIRLTVGKLIQPIEDFEGDVEQ